MARGSRDRFRQLPLLAHRREIEREVEGHGCGDSIGNEGLAETWPVRDIRALKLEEIGMGPGSGENDLVFRHLVDQQPIRRDMALPVPFPLAPSGCGRAAAGSGVPCRSASTTDSSRWGS